MYATFTGLRLGADGSVFYALAASPPLLHWHASGNTLSNTEEPQFPLGLLPVPRFAGSTLITAPGDLLVVASLILALAWILLSKKLMQTHSPPVVTAYTILAGTAMLAVVVLGPWALSPLTHSSAGPPPFARLSMTAWVALVLSGLFCTALTTLLWNWGIHHVPASRAGVFLNIEPALGSYLGVKLLGEHLGPYAWAGGGLILAAAITLTTRNQEAGAVGQPEVILE